MFRPDTDPRRFASIHVHRSSNEVHLFIAKCIGQIFQPRRTICVFHEELVTHSSWEMLNLPHNDVSLAPTQAGSDHVHIGIQNRRCHEIWWTVLQLETFKVCTSKHDTCSNWVIAINKWGCTSRRCHTRSRDIDQCITLVTLLTVSIR